MRHNEAGKEIDLSICVPCFNEESCIELFYDNVCRVLEKLSKSSEKMRTEFIFVDDGSTDSTLFILQRLSKKNDHVRYVSFSRNFGKESALLAALDRARGDIVVVMDVDMQDPPSLLPKLWEAVVSGNCDIARVRRVNRKGEPYVRSWFARRFYGLANRLMDVDIVDGARDYIVMNRAAVEALLRMREFNRFFKGMAGWIGFKVAWFDYENAERAAGDTKWSFFGLVSYAVDGIAAFSTKPLVVSSIFGVMCSGLAVLLILLLVVRTLIFGDPVAGWPSMICIFLFVGGIQLLCLGILGQYVAKTYLEVKHRPIYLIREESQTHPDT